MASPTGQATYREAGVDIDAGDALVRALAPMARATRIPGVMGALGGFGALFDPKAAGFVDPILVSTTDGVGTKLKVAIETGLHAEVGIDLVAMCVNDLVVQGARPLFFLDYFATGRLSVEHAAKVIGGVAEGCRIAGCALVGGETAEMPGLYAGDDYDLAGFAVGAAERGTLLPRSDIEPGDVVLGLASSGIHSNGFSLVRRILAALDASLTAPAPFSPNRPLADALMTPTRIYCAALLALHAQRVLKAAAHITGGGLPGNLPRILPEGRIARLRPAAWTPPAVFAWLAQAGPVDTAEMLRVFNCGIGMALVVAQADAEPAMALLRGMGEVPIAIGQIEAAQGTGAPRVEFDAFPQGWLAGG